MSFPAGFVAASESCKSLNMESNEYLVAKVHKEALAIGAMELKEQEKTSWRNVFIGVIIAGREQANT